MAQRIAIGLVLATVILLVFDYIRSRWRHYRHAKVKAEVDQRVQQVDTRSMEKCIDAKVDEMETLKGLSGKFSSAMGHQVRASMLTPIDTQRRKMTDSQIVKDIAEKNAEIARLAATKPVL